MCTSQLLQAFQHGIIAAYCMQKLHMKPRNKFRTVVQSTDYTDAYFNKVAYLVQIIRSLVSDEIAGQDKG